MKFYLVIGTYTEGESNGIYIYDFDSETGNTSFIDSVSVNNPSYLVINHKKDHIYSVSENDDKESSIVNSFFFNKATGKISFQNSQSAFGAAPCYITIELQDKYIVTANYMGGSISVFKTKSDGSLNPMIQQVNFSGSSIHDVRQNQSHLHCTVFSPDYDYLFATDLGSDRIYKFKVNYSEESNFLTFCTPAYINVAPGSGPRHLVFHQNKRFAYLINELGGTIVAFKYTNGNLEEIQTTISDEYKAEGSADIHIHPNGKFLYSSNRLKKDGISIFKIDENTGKLTPIDYERTNINPRNFVISPNGKFLIVANQDSDTIQVFSIDLKYGLLHDTNQNIKLDMPVCLKFISP